jgi:hypothetical protein
MAQVEDLFRFYTEKFQFFSAWSKPLELSLPRRLFKIGSFVFLKVVPASLMTIKLFEVEKIEDFVHSLMYTVAYNWQVLFGLAFEWQRPKLKRFMRQFLETINEQPLAIPYVYEACEKATEVSKWMYALFFVGSNVPTVLFPALAGTLPIPMYLPSWASSGVGFAVALVYQLLVQNFSVVTYLGVMLAFVLWMLIVGYARFVSASIRELSPGSVWYDGHKELVMCVRMHQRLQK